VILVAGMTVIGVWVTRRIEDGVVHRTASTTAVYVDSLIASSVQEITPGQPLPVDAQDRLEWLMTDTPLGQQVAMFRVWDTAGSIIYSTMPEEQTAPETVDGDYREAVLGEVSAHMGAIEGDATSEDLADGPLLEIYSPIRRTGTDEVIAVAEFYYGAEELQDDLAAAERESWLIVAGITAVIYLLLAAFVQRSSNTIQRQQRALGEQVQQLRELLERNEELTARVQSAAKRTTALNERFLRRVSAELHDGPAQDMSVALLQLDHVQEQVQTGAVNGTTSDSLETIKQSMTRALNDIRAASSGLILPQLGNLDLAGTIQHAVRTHTVRTGSPVSTTIAPYDRPAELPVKIAIYRVVQEALANGWRHAGGAGQYVQLDVTPEHLVLTVGDTGAGFDTTATIDPEHLGLVGMRERIESLGGTFVVTSEPGEGTRVMATLPIGGQGNGHE
ncbi:MAG: sensor histidine kinase, partial [Chloroflexota bacterium]|nr:sensor histidine kinase [Chloroflexota bacterium]